MKVVLVICALIAFLARLSLQQNIRFVHGAPNVGAIDLYVNKTLAASNIDFGQVSGYWNISSADTTMMMKDQEYLTFDLVPTGQQLSSESNSSLTDSFTLNTTSYYTIVAYGLTPKLVILEDADTLEKAQLLSGSSNISESYSSSASTSSSENASGNTTDTGYVRVFWGAANGPESVNILFDDTNLIGMSLAEGQASKYTLIAVGTKNGTVIDSSNTTSGVAASALYNFTFDISKDDIHSLFLIGDLSSNNITLLDLLDNNQSPALLVIQPTTGEFAGGSTVAPAEGTVTNQTAENATATTGTTAAAGETISCGADEVPEVGFQSCISLAEVNLRCTFSTQLDLNGTVAPNPSGGASTASLNNTSSESSSNTSSSSNTTESGSSSNTTSGSASTASTGSTSCGDGYCLFACGDVCYYRGTHVCTLQTKVCPWTHPKSCGNHCYRDSDYVCISQDNGGIMCPKEAPLRCGLFCYSDSQYQCQTDTLVFIGGLSQGQGASASVGEQNMTSNLNETSNANNTSSTNNQGTSSEAGNQGTSSGTSNQGNTSSGASYSNTGGTSNTNAGVNTGETNASASNTNPQGSNNANTNASVSHSKRLKRK